jgi:hypothetical protein
MLRVEAVAERVGDHLVGHHPMMPSVGKTSQALIATRRLEDGLHASMMTIDPFQCKTAALPESWRGKRRHRECGGQTTSNTVS